MFIRPPTDLDIAFCCNLVAENWGIKAADRCHMQMREHFKAAPYSPVFLIADAGDGCTPIGFAAFQPSMRMNGAYDFIWIAVDNRYQGSGAGKLLMQRRLDEVERRGATVIELVTQKPDYFYKFGFDYLVHLGNDWHLMLKLLKSVQI